MVDPESVQRLKKIRDLFEQAFALPETERFDFLEKACGADKELHEEISTLLAEADSAESPFDDLVNDMIWPTLKSFGSDPSKLQNYLDGLHGADDNIEDPLIGKSVSHFEVLAPIGRGGMGVVYRARDLTLDRIVALKFLPPVLSLDQDAKDRFIHEAKAASGLDHPNIATIHEIGETGDKQLFIAMGYYKGESLKERIKKGPISPDTAIEYAIQLASGLKEAHRQGVIHRDIKSGNIMITTEGTVILLDFGVAKLSYESGYTQVGQMVGTIAYMSPEQARGEAVDQRTDIWSFGVVLYEMLTGQPPFGGDNAPSAIRAILEEDPEPPISRNGEIPQPLHEILGLCLAKNLDERYQRVDDLLEDLRRARKGLQPIKRRGRATWNRRLRRRMWATLSASLFILSVLTLLILNHWTGDSQIEQAIELGPETNNNAVVVESRQKADRDNEAVQILEELWRQNPDSGRALSLATLYDKSRSQFDEAMIWYRNAHSLEPENQRVAARIADLYFLMGDIENANWWMERSLEIAPDSQVSKGLRLKLHLLRGEMAEAVEYFRTHSLDISDFDPDLIHALLEALLDIGNSEQALAICKQFLSPYLNLPDFEEGRATFRVVDDPFDLRQNKVLEFDPGELVGEIEETVPEIYNTRWPPRIREAAYRLPNSALGRKRSTLYIKVGRPTVNGLPGETNMVWGLATGEGFSDYAITDYSDLSVHGRFEQDGIMDIRDGESYVELSEFALDSNTYHELWFVIDHANNNYDLHIRGGRQFPEQTAVYTGARFRKATEQVLDYFVLIGNLGLNGDDIPGNDPIYFDDIYLEPHGENLRTPDTEWILVDDFEDGDVSDWLVRLRRSDRILDAAHVGSALLVARVLQDIGEKGHAEKILDAAQTALENTWLPDENSNVFILTRIHALRGERDKVLEGIRKLIDSGYSIWFRNGSFERGEFLAFQQDPGFRELVSKAGGNLEAQYARIQYRDARGEFAPIPSLPQELVANSPVTFMRITDGAIVEDTGNFIGVGWGDYDNDGYLDVAVANAGETKPIHLYHNNGNGSFNRVSEGIAVTDPISPMSPSWADVDNDGDLDLFVSTDANSVDAFFRNNGAGNFIKETIGDWVNTLTTGSAAAWCDYDNNGFVDLYLTRYWEPNILYHNDGNGAMTPVEIDAIAVVGESRGCLWSDYDGDGDVDLFVGGQDKVQFRNDGNGTFEWISPENGGIPRPVANLNIAFSSADYDNDGDLDLLYTNWKSDPSSLLYRNEGEGGFVNVTRVLPSGGSIEGMGSVWGDYDNDGFQDLFIANHRGNNLLYHNEGDGSFTRVIEDPVVSEDLESGGCAWVDYDNDGDLDLFVANGFMSDAEQSNELYRNEGGTNNWILLKLIGSVSNRSAIGAKVWALATIEGQDVTQLRELGGNGNSQTDLRVHFGLGDAATVETLRVEWPSGHVQEISDVAANQFLTITESVPAPHRPGD